MTSRFCRYELRTTDVSAARGFYSDVLGSEIWGSDVSVIPLPERAAARGAPAHWLGHIGVDDVETMVARVVALGGQRLGATEPGDGGSRRAVLRDPFGAVMAVSSDGPVPSRALVLWHLLHASDHEPAFAAYEGLFGWRATELVELGPERGCHQMFAWDASGPSVGSVTNTARLPHIHPQWLFCFRVAEIEAALVEVSARGGTALETRSTSAGDLVVPCNDAQGAAFALYQVVRGRG